MPDKTMIETVVYKSPSKGLHRLNVTFTDGEEISFRFSRLDSAQEAAARLERTKGVASVKYLGPNAHFKEEQFE